MTGYGIRTSPDENQLRMIPAGSLHRKVAASRLIPAKDA
jgi:hypothetical protein